MNSVIGLLEELGRNPLRGAADTQAFVGLRRQARLYCALLPAENDSPSDPDDDGGSSEPAPDESEASQQAN